MIRNMAAGMVGGITGMTLMWCLLAASGRTTTRLRVFLAVGVLMGAIGPVVYQAAR